MGVGEPIPENGWCPEETCSPTWDPGRACGREDFPGKRSQGGKFGASTTCIQLASDWRLPRHPDNPSLARRLGEGSRCWRKRWTESLALASGLLADAGSPPWTEPGG